MSLSRITININDPLRFGAGEKYKSNSTTDELSFCVVLMQKKNSPHTEESGQYLDVTFSVAPIVLSDDL
jgi:hypothetical protein